MKSENENKINGCYGFYDITEQQKIRCNVLTSAGKELANVFDAVCPYSRELSIALTKLEEAVMWANAAIVRGPIDVNDLLDEIDRGGD